MRRSLPCAAATALAVLAAGCIPYSVGTTARPAPKGDPSVAVVAYSIPGGVEIIEDSASVPFAGLDLEMRFGVDERSDVGVRIPSASGAVLNYKRLFTEPDPDAGFAAAWMAGAGVVNFGSHAYLEGTLLASGREDSVTPYGGLRVSQVIPLEASAVEDSPTAGGFAGVRFGDLDGGVSVELGVYHDESALEIRSRSVIFVPSITLHGQGLVNRILGRR